jgi:tetratricopeptide (TPR) repeat protein
LLDGGQWDTLTQVLGALEARDTDADYRDRLGNLAVAASQAQPLASPTGAQRAVRYAAWAFPLLQDRRLAAWRLVELASLGLPIPPDVMDEVRKWADQARSQQAADAPLWVLRGRFAELANDLAAANESYEQSAKLDPNSLGELASFHRRQKNAEQLAEAGRRAMEHFESRLQEKPDDPLARATLADVYADQGRWAEARQMLAAADKNPQLRPALAAICIRQFDAAAAASLPAAPAVAKPAEGAAAPAGKPGTEETQPKPRTPPCELLGMALHHVPDYGPAVARLESELERELATGGDVVHRLLIELLGKGESPAALHRLLGLRASELKDWPAAVGHWEHAVRLVPDDAFLRNNLAYALMQANKKSYTGLARAETLATEALQMVPEHPEILATRGEILLRMEKYKAAAVDLEKSAAALPQRSDLHQLLADCYEKLGMADLAKSTRLKAR